MLLTRRRIPKKESSVKTILDENEKEVRDGEKQKMTIEKHWPLE